MSLEDSYFRFDCEVIKYRRIQYKQKKLLLSAFHLQFKVIAVYSFLV